MVLVFLSGCVFPGPSCGYDMNCNKNISNTAWYKKRTSCINEQQSVAKKYCNRITMKKLIVKFIASVLKIRTINLGPETKLRS